jgi:hypothetical protein
MRSRFRILLITALWAITPSLLAWDLQDEGTCRVTGVYSNGLYGFKVAIPEGLAGCPDSLTCCTGHGVTIPLGRQSGSRSIKCYAGYNIALFESAAAQADADIHDLNDQAAPGTVSVESRQDFQLSGLKALRVVIRYADKKSGRPMVRDTTYALRPVLKDYDMPWHEYIGTHYGIPSQEYVVSLTGTQSQYEADRKVLETVLASWRPLSIFAVPYWENGTVPTPGAEPDDFVTLARKADSVVLVKEGFRSSFPDDVTPKIDLEVVEQLSGPPVESLSVAAAVWDVVAPRTLKREETTFLLLVRDREEILGIEQNGIPLLIRPGMIPIVDSVVPMEYEWLYDFRLFLHPVTLAMIRDRFARKDPAR